MLCRITVSNRGPEDAPLHLLPTLWFRNTWSCPAEHRQAVAAGAARRARASSWPSTTSSARGTCTRADDATLLFCDNETNAARLWSATDSPPFPKDGIADHVVHGTADA